MNFFSSYIGLVLTIGICAFICETLCGCFANSMTVSRTVGIITSLCVFISIILPICTALNKLGFDNFSIREDNKATATSYDSLYDLAENRLENQISQSIYEELGIMPASISIELNVDEEYLNIQNVSVVLEKGDFTDEPKISKYLKSMFGSQTQINILETANEHQE